MMKPASLALLLLLPLAAAGCRSGDPSVALVENEARYLEDRLLDLQYEYEQKCAELESCRLENDSLRQALERGDSSRSYSPLPVPEFEEDIDIDLGSVLPLEDANDDASPPEDLQVTRIVLNGRLTGGYDFDGRPGDEGISVLIEPQNAAHQYVPLPGEISVVVLDPAKEGSAARVARWDLSREKTTPLLRRSAMGRGIHLELPWPNEPPTNRDLQVFVRYTSPEGEEFEDHHNIQVDVPGAISNRWTPSGSRGLAESSPSETPSAPAPLVADLRSEDVFGGPPSPATQPATPPATSGASPPVIGETSPGIDIQVPLPGDASPSPQPGRDRRPLWRPFR